VRALSTLAWRALRRFTSSISFSPAEMCCNRTAFNNERAPPWCHRLEGQVRIEHFRSHEFFCHDGLDRGCQHTQRHMPAHRALGPAEDGPQRQKVLQCLPEHRPDPMCPLGPNHSNSKKSIVSF